MVSVSGAVSNRTVEIGQNVSPGQEMMKIIPLDAANIWVTANFKETQLGRMKPGQRVDIEVDATGKTYKGHVDSIAGASGERFSALSCSFRCSISMVALASAASRSASIRRNIAISSEESE